MKACNGFWNCITPDAWLNSFETLIGSFLGASLASMFALWTVKKQLNHQVNREEINESSNFLKVSSDFESRISFILDEGKQLIKSIANDDISSNRFQQSTINKAEKLATFSTVIFKELSEMNLDKVPDEIYREYNTAKFIIGSLEIEKIIGELKQPRNTDYMYYNQDYDRLAKAIQHLEEVYKAINSFSSNKQLGLKKHQEK